MLNLFAKKEKVLIGVVHLLPLPGSPKFSGDLQKVQEAAVHDALALLEGGADAILIENYGDIPYFVREPPLITVIAMSYVVHAIKNKILNDVPIGINVQFDAYKAELALASVYEASFIRVEGFIDTLLADTGLVTPCAAEVLRLRRQFSAERVQIWADVQVKETQVLGTRSIVEAAKAAAKNMADAVIITGSATGEAPSAEILKRVREVVKVPILVGSGVSLKNVAELLAFSDGAIVGTALKVDGRISQEKVRELKDIMRYL